MRLNLDALKYHYENDHAHLYGWVRVINDVQFLHAHGVKIEKLSTNGDQEEGKSIRLTDKPLIALYMALGCLDG